MFYRVAIIQNEKEIFKYDCADCSKLIHSLSCFDYYKIFYFDEHNIDEFFSDIFKFDSAFFATNALNAKLIFEACIKNSELIESFIKKQHGIYIGYSSKKKSREFLPDRYKCYQEERSFLPGDDEFSGKIAVRNEYYCSLFNDFSINEYISCARNHTTIAGLYFDFLLYDAKKTLFEEVIIDEKYKRCLLLFSRAITKERVCISTLPVDWQNQINLFINILRYITEGTPEICIVSKKEIDRYENFSYEYLSRQLNLYKKSCIRICRSNCDLDGVVERYPSSNIVLFDASWGVSEIAEICANSQPLINSRNLRILHCYQNEKITDVSCYDLLVHSAYQVFDLYESQLILRLQSCLPDEKQNYSFDSNLIATFEAVKLLKANGIINQTLFNGIVDVGKKRLIPNGSYDSMFIASCTFLSLWSKCNEGVVYDTQYILLEDYILREFKTSYDKISTYEKAQAIYYLDGVISFPEELYSRMIHEIISKMKSATNKEMLGYGYSNCWKAITLPDAYKIVGSDYSAQEVIELLNRQILVFDDFSSDLKTVIVANFVSAMSYILKHGLVVEKDELRYIYQSLFSALGFMYDRYNSDFLDDVYSSCVLVNAFKMFSKLAIYPIDEILSLVDLNSNSEFAAFAKVNNFIDKSVELANKISEQNYSLLQLKSENETQEKNIGLLESKIKNLNSEKEQLDLKLSGCGQRLKSEKTKNKKKTLLVIWIIIVTLVFCYLFAWFSYSIAENNYVFFNDVIDFLKLKAWPFFLVLLGYPISAFIQSCIDIYSRKGLDDQSN